MYVIAEFTIVPIGAGVSLSAYVAECEKMLRESGLTYTLHANGTNLEGEWEEVNALVRACHERLHDMGVPRIYTVMKYATRTDREQHMSDKLRSVAEKIRQPPAP